MLENTGRWGRKVYTDSKEIPIVTEYRIKAVKLFALANKRNRVKITGRT